MHPFSPFPFMPCHVLAFNAVSGMEEEEPFDPDNARDAIKCCLCPCYHGGIKPTTDGRCRCCWCWCWWWWCRGYLNTPSLTHTYPLTHTHTLSPSHTLSLSLLSTPPHYHYHCHYHYYHPPSLSLSLLSPPITPHHYHCRYYHPPSPPLTITVATITPPHPPSLSLSLPLLSPPLTVPTTTHRSVDSPLLCCMGHSHRPHLLFL